MCIKIAHSVSLLSDHLTPLLSSNEVKPYVISYNMLLIIQYLVISVLTHQPQSQCSVVLFYFLLNTDDTEESGISFHQVLLRWSGAPYSFR